MHNMYYTSLPQVDMVALLDDPGFAEEECCGSRVLLGGSGGNVTAGCVFGLLLLASSRLMPWLRQFSMAAPSPMWARADAQLHT